MDNPFSGMRQLKGLLNAEDDSATKEVEDYFARRQRLVALTTIIACFMAALGGALIFGDGGTLLPNSIMKARLLGVGVLISVPLIMIGAQMMMFGQTVKLLNRAARIMYTGYILAALSIIVPMFI